MSGIAFLITAALSYLCNFVVHLLLNTLLPKFGLIENISYKFEMSLPALLSCFAVSVLCGFLSCAWPYLLWKRDRKKVGGRISVNG